MGKQGKNNNFNMDSRSESLIEQVAQRKIREIRKYQDVHNNCWFDTDVRGYKQRYRPDTCSGVAMDAHTTEQTLDTGTFCINSMLPPLAWLLFASHYYLRVIIHVCSLFPVGDPGEGWGSCGCPMLECMLLSAGVSRVV